MFLSFYPSGCHTGLVSAHLSLFKTIRDPSELLLPYTAFLRAYPVTKHVIKYFINPLKSIITNTSHANTDNTFFTKNNFIFNIKKMF